MRIQSEAARFFVWLAGFVAVLLIAMFVLMVLALAYGGWVFPAAMVTTPLLIAAVLEYRHRRKTKPQNSVKQSATSVSATDIH